MMMSHIPDVDLAFAKIYKLLNPGGICLVALSRFHPPENRLERNGRKYEVEEIDADQYIDKSTDGMGFGVADINRSPEYYARHAASAGFKVEQTEFADAGYSLKLLFILRKE